MRSLVLAAALLGSEAQPPTMPPRGTTHLAAIKRTIPATPYPGQIRADARGKCPWGSHTSITGGCWIKIQIAPEECVEEKESPELGPTLHLHEGGCYVPSYPPPRPSTS